MLAEERRWRLKLDAVQDSLDKHSASIETLQKQSSAHEARLATHEADARRSASAAQRVESQVTEQQSQLRMLQPCLDKQTEAVRSLTARSDALEDTVSKMSAEVQMSKSALTKIEDLSRESEVARLEVQANVNQRVEQLAQQSDSLAEQVAAQGSDMKRGTEMTNGLIIRMDASEERCVKLADTLRQQGETVSGLVDQSGGFTEKLAAQGAEICSAEALARKVQSQVQAAEKERLAELRVVCEKLEVQNQSTSSLSNRVQTQMADVEEGLVRALADLSSEMAKKMEGKADCSMLDESLGLRDQRVAEIAGQLGELMAGEERINRLMGELAKLAEALDSRDERFDSLRAELKEGLAEKATSTQLEQATETLHSWVEEVRETLRAWSQQAHKNTTAELEHTRSVTAEHGVTLTRHSHLLENISAWCQQVRVREQGLTHVIMHVVEKSSPEQLKMFEEILSVPQLRRT